MERIKTILIGLLLIIICAFITGCNNIKYNAKLYGNVGEWIERSFLNENKIKAYYLNENYVEGENYPDEQYIYESDAPKERTFILESDLEFKKIFTNCNEQIDFNKEIVILYIFPDVNHLLDYELKSVECNNGVLLINTKLCSSNINGATAPFPRCFMIKIDKIEITEVKVEFKG